MRSMIVALLGVALAAPAMAGGKYGKCEQTTQACLDEMSASLKHRGWVGIEMDQDEESGAMTVNRVVAGSPAESAGFQQGDVLKAVNGIEFGEKNEAKLKGLREVMTPGATVKYTVERAGKSVDLDIKLAELPPQVMAQWVGMHMLEHTKVDVAQK